MDFARGQLDPGQPGLDIIDGKHVVDLIDLRFIARATRGRGHIKM